MSLRNSYVVGFLLSIALTFIAYFAVVNDWFDENTLGIIMLLALAQFSVQVVFFLHMGKTSKPTWSDVALYFMIMVVVTIILGSMWIMSNLDYHHGDNSAPQSVEDSIIEDEGFRNDNSYDVHDNSQPHKD
ncbi:cytochrome o ubiquinol oxidase subunit IV [Candidatus Saccharibacteria bacterium]|nr:cytochrome o ubiquinol oxidase subunit IV [Candidatus Saccharibacteria bacterium]